MQHDYYRNSCPDQSNVMAINRKNGVQMFKWSNCSASELRAYRIAGGTKCLMETDPANSLVKPSFPGRQFNLTYQCKAMFGDHAIACPWWSTTVSSSCFAQCSMNASIALGTSHVGFDLHMLCIGLQIPGKWKQNLYFTVFLC